MPIMNTVIKGGGVQPSGTIGINSNGIHDVSSYANADVQVPTTAPDFYVERIITNGSVAPGPHKPSFATITTVPDYGLAYVLAYNNLVSGALDLSTVTSVGTRGFEYAFYNCSSITSVDLSGITTAGNYTFGHAFSGCSSLTSVDLSSLTSVTAAYAFTYAFEGCALTSIDLSNLERFSAGYAFQYAFKDGRGNLTISFDSFVGFYQADFQYAFQNYTGQLHISFPALVSTFSGNSSFSNMCNGATGLRSVDFINLKEMGGYQCFNYAFNGCTGLTELDLSSVICIGSNGRQTCNDMCYGCTNLKTVKLDNLRRIVSGEYNMRYAFYNCSKLDTISFPKLTYIGNHSNGVLQYAFGNCTRLPDLSFPSLAYTTTNFNTAFNNMLYGCSGKTVHFPADWQTTMSTWSNITNGMGGTNTTILFDLPSVTTADLSDIEYLDITGGIGGLYQNCTGITSANAGNLAYVSNGGISYLFSGCTSLVSADFGKLVYASANACLYSLFSNCSSLTTVNFSSLKNFGGYNNCQNMFQNCTSLTTLSFPAAKTFSQQSTFSGFLSGCSNVTVHLPSNMTGISASTLGGTNTTVLYDLPAANILTGVNTVRYERNPKYDTATALAWRVEDGGTTAEPIIDFTPYYTNGTTSPSVGDTIYSDDACTIAVTTISSIS